MSKRLHLFVMLIATGALVTRAAESHATPDNAPANVSNPVAETALTTLTLAESAEERLGISTATVAKQPRPQLRLYNGEVVLPLAQPQGEEKASNSSFTPNPPATPAEVLALAESQLLADGELQKIRVRLELAEIREERARTLVGAQSGSQRDLDDAFAAARSERTSLEIAGRYRGLLGASVAEMVKLDHVWVRVPVYVGDLPLLDQTQPANVGGLGKAAGSTARPARWVDGPPFATPAAATVDLFCRVNNSDHSLRLGQRVGVSIPLKGEQESLVVPWAAVLHDVQGGQWVYEKLPNHTYVRRRVSVARVEGKEAVLSAGPIPGVEVVCDGAAELFGTEFGAGH